MRRVTHSEVIDGLIAKKGIIVLLGGIDTGKTTFGLEIASAARDAGVPAAIVDSDVGQSTVGPPTCVGLKHIDDLSEVTMESVGEADELAFVGSTSPEGHLLPLMGGTARLVGHARGSGAEIVVVDTTGYVSGYYAQILKYYKLDLLHPDTVVGFQRGEELEPILGVVRRFFPTELISLKVESAIVERSALDRAAERERKFAGYFREPLTRWRLKTSVFMPPLPPALDLSELDGLVVGLEDGKGRCRGIGLLEYDAADLSLRMVSPVGESASGLRLGSLRINADGKMVGRTDIRALFGN